MNAIKKLDNGLHFVLKEKPVKGTFARHIHWHVSCKDEPGIYTITENFTGFLESMGYTKEQIINAFRGAADEMSSL